MSRLLDSKGLLADAEFGDHRRSFRRPAGGQPRHRVDEETKCTRRAKADGGFAEK